MNKYRPRHFAPVLIQRLPNYPTEWDLPKHQTEEAAGFDLRANYCLNTSAGVCCVEGAAILTNDLEGKPNTAGKVMIFPGGRAVFGTGLAVALPTGLMMQIAPRSSVDTKLGITVANSPGIIDSDYRGEIKVALVNQGRLAQIIEPGQRIAQGLLVPYAQAEWELVDHLPETTRGSGGFGSTG